LYSRDKITLRRKNGVYFYNSKHQKVSLQVQKIFIILLSLFVIRDFKGTSSSVEMLKGNMVTKRLGTPEVSINWVFASLLIAQKFSISTSLSK